MLEAGILNPEGDMPDLTWDSQARRLVAHKQTPLKQPGERNAMSVGGGIQECEPGAQVSCPQEGQSPSRFPASRPTRHRAIHGP